jgi:hypothetical protein
VSAKPPSEVFLDIAVATGPRGSAYAAELTHYGASVTTKTLDGRVDGSEHAALIAGVVAALDELKLSSRVLIRIGQHDTCVALREALQAGSLRRAAERHTVTVRHVPGASPHGQRGGLAERARELLRNDAG